MTKKATYKAFTTLIGHCGHDHRTVTTAVGCFRDQPLNRRRVLANRWDGCTIMASDGQFVLRNLNPKEDAERIFADALNGGPRPRTQPQAGGRNTMTNETTDSGINPNLRTIRRILFGRNDHSPRELLIQMESAARNAAQSGDDAQRHARNAAQAWKPEDAEDAAVSAEDERRNAAFAVGLIDEIQTRLHAGVFTPWFAGGSRGATQEQVNEINGWLGRSCRAFNEANEAERNATLDAEEARRNADAKADSFRECLGKADATIDAAWDARNAAAAAADAAQDAAAAAEETPDDEYRRAAANAAAVDAREAWRKANAAGAAARRLEEIAANAAAAETARDAKDALLATSERARTACATAEGAGYEASQAAKEAEAAAS